MIATKNILFIGAGASVGARLHLPRRPPLGNELCSWLRGIESELLRPGLADLRVTVEEGFGILKRWPTENNFEALLSKLEGDDVFRMQRLLMVAFSDLTDRPTNMRGSDLGFETRADLYDDLVEILGINSADWAIVSLNYDLLFESALIRKGIPYRYPQFPDRSTCGANEPLKVYKPHGSINFFANGQYQGFHANGAAARPMPTTFSISANGRVTPDFGIVFAAPPGADNVLWVANGSSISLPVMANYRKGKDILVNFRQLNSVRAESVAEFQTATRLVVIGVRMIDASDDQFVSDIFKIRFQSMDYICGNTAEGESVRKLHDNAEIFDRGLAAYLNSKKR
ncbi:SIR2 family protein [bacterium]|nr:SIR2 family protein [bacterium]